MKSLSTKPRREVARAVTALTLASAVAAGAAVAASQEKAPRATDKTLDRAAVNKMLNDWPAGPQLAAQEMMAKYGAPREATSERIIWHNAGPYKRIMLTREQLPHNFPITHLDYLEHTISYKVPTEKSDEVHEFDASITIHPGSGELSARCDLESNNVLTLNLANDIIKNGKSVDDARKEFGQAVTDRTLGKAPPITMKLQFQPMTMMAAADREKVTIEGSPLPANAEMAVGTSGSAADPVTASGDAEIMALLIALNENEVHAAMAAEEKKVDGAILAYAKTLHKDHGKNIADTQQLGLKIGLRPIESAAADKLHAKGAQQLAKIVPLVGAEFGPAFVAQMATGHQDALKMIDGWLKSTQNDALKQHLTATRSHLEHHLAEAQKLQGGKR